MLEHDIDDGAEDLDRLAQLHANGVREREPRAEMLRIPPQALEAEQAVLGGLMLGSPASARAWYDVCDLLVEGDFYRHDHQLIWRAIAAQVKAARPHDSLTVGDWFDSQGLADRVANGAYLSELASTTPSVANIRAYADIVADKARLRHLIDVGTELVNAGFQPEGRGSVELIGEAQSRIGGLLVNEPCELEAVQPIMQRVFDRLQERYHHGAGGVSGMSTGITDFDEIINGLKPGLYVLAARPKMGKTTLAQNIAEYCGITLRKPCAIFSFEMQPDELGDRMLSSQGDVDGDAIRRGTLDEMDWANVSAAMRKLRGAQIFVSKPRNARVEHVVAQARRQHARAPLGLIVIDYLQLMHVAGDNRSQGFGDITRALKLMSGELGVPVLLLSQLNRDLEKRPDKRPMPSDLRDSGAIEQDADAVIFIYRDEYYHPNSPDKGTAEIIVALQRNGPPGMARVRYRPERFRFENLSPDWEPERSVTVEKPARRGMRRARGGNPGAEAAAGDGSDS
ncbi:replicative DNA helicase [Luteimonas sp BLCC-B24]|uniref:replicative DNA helicase n=1 Tax=Luteimonas sp. BLCC-B24 TaxID=3025317 RepID=UPI00234CC66B|nr:replicative DNA helicase [Luteimonas sp. BLCC-B24]MDC7805552.1 replicative DNA helicase [Luteimonas sp. BLCC-B24]